MRDDIKQAWDAAFEHPGEAFPVGRAVVCDLCDGDWTDRPESGGFLFQSKGVCPDCAPKFMADLIRYSEQNFIRGECPKGQSFADWIRHIRGPDAFVRVTVLN
jgi:hypothetical protein